MRFKVIKIILIGLMACLVITAICARIHRPNNLNIEKNRDNLMVALMQKDYKPLLHETEEMLNGSKIVLIATATGNNEYVFGNLKQEVRIDKYLKGKEKAEPGKHIQIVGTGNREGKQNGKLAVATGFINYLQKGDQYLIFANRWQKSYGEEESVLEMNLDAVTMRCLNLDSDQSKVYQTSSPYTEYKNVKDSEFFVSDKKVLEEMLALKKRLVQKWVV